MKIRSLLPLAAIALLATVQAFAADVTVKSTGYHGQKGKAIVYLWKPGAEGFPSKTENAVVSKTVDITPAGVTVTFSDVAPGTYAISITHDENENGKMDTGFMGKPKEGYGASNNPQNKLSAPSFDQCKFDVPASGKTVEITMRY
jgi:uncharacterized protein (DUF2141 family)